MSSKLGRKKEQTESIFTTGYRFFAQLVDYIICIYLLLIIVAMPFYYQREQGYKTIGTSKYLFFRWTIEHTGQLLLPVLVCLAFCGVVRIRKEKERSMAVCLKTWVASFTITDMFALLYGCSVLISYAASNYKDTALWGANGWYMGLIPQLVSVLAYFCISRLWERRDWIFLLLLPVSAVVFGLGILNRFGCYPIDMQLERADFISTIGNINWYCGYLVSVFFAGVYLLWQKTETSLEVLGQPRTVQMQIKCKRVLLILYVAVGFAALVTQGSMSGFLALGAVLLALFCMSADSGRRMWVFWQLVLILAVVCMALWGIRTRFPAQMTFSDAVTDLFTDSMLPVGLAMLAIFFLLLVGWMNRRGRYSVKLFRGLTGIVFCATAFLFVAVVGMIAWNTKYPGSLGSLSQNEFFTFSPTWGSNRGATWQAGLMCLKEENMLQRLIGVGPDSMEAFINDAGSEQLHTMITERFMNLRLTNAHCEWLSIWINMGLLGCVSYGGMMISAIICFLRDKKGNTVIAGACGLCVLAYTVNNIVSFQQSMSLATIFVVLGMGRAYQAARRKKG
ncbi:MAG: O-antigen ligase family protein [Lachnospiraceae bacterium]|nr:O-antigen ligase family protein [Lachnospiraceae bacterium]